MRKRSLSRSPYAMFAALIFVTMAAHSAFRLFAGKQYAGYQHSMLIDGMLAAAWLSAALATLIAQPRSLFVALIGLFATFTHAWLGAVALGWGALPFFLATAALIFLLRKSFGLFNPTDTQHARHRPLPRAPA